jgi:hypothetical protein
MVVHVVVSQELVVIFIEYILSFSKDIETASWTPITPFF